MKRTCIINCKNNCAVPPPSLWKNKTAPGQNRLYYIIGGTGKYLEDGIMLPFEAGKLYFIPAHSGVATYTEETDLLVHAFVNYDLVPPIVSNKVFCLDPDLSPKIQKATEAFIELCKGDYNKRTKTTPLTPTEENELAILSSMTVYLTECAVNTSPNKVINDPAVITALNIIHTELSEKHTVAYIAKKCCMSTDGFIRKFTRYIGETPYSYIKKLKINTALTMRAEGATLDETAEACGYSDSTALLHAIASEKNYPQ